MATDRIQLQVLRSKDVLSGSTADFEVAKHFDGVTSPKLPTSEQLEFGEIALNIAKGYEVISIKNYDGEIIYLPFNVAQRLLDTNVSLNDLREYTITTIKSFSADTIVHFDSVYDYINGINTQLSNTIQEAYNTLSGRIESVDETLTTTIESFSADVITQITNLGYALEGLNNKTESIIRASTELLNDKIDELSANTSTGFTELQEKLDNDLSERIAEFSADTQSRLNDIESIMLSAATTELVSKTSGNVVTIVEREFSGTIDSIVERIDSVDSKVDDVNNILHDEITSASGNIISQIEVVEEELLDNINDLSGNVQTISEGLDSNIQKHDKDIAVLSINTIYNCTRITELSKSLEDVSATTNSKIDNLKLIDLNDVEVSSPTITPNEFNVAIYEDNKLKTKIVGNTSTEKYGLVKVGSGITVNNGVISVVQIIDETVKSGSTNAVSSNAVYKEIKRVDGEISDINDKMAVISDEDIEDGVTDAPVVNIVNATYATQAMYDSEGHIIANIFSVASVLESRITELEKLVGRLAECERRLDVVESKIRLLESINYITY